MEYMAITEPQLYAILYAARNGANFKRTLTIGRQLCYVKHSKIDKLFKAYNSFYTPECSQKIRNALNMSKLTDESPPYVDELFRYLGADIVDSLDYSDYEKTTIVHDMNLPIGEDLKKFLFLCIG
jgi:hypothetical protein